MCLHELAVSDSWCSPCAGNCSQDFEVLVRALQLRLVRLNLVYFYISGQTNCSGFARRKKPPSDLFLLVTMSGKIGEMKLRQRRLVELCVDNCKLSGWRETHVSCVIIFFSFDYLFLLSTPWSTLPLFLRFSLSTILFDFYLSLFLLYSLTSLFSFYSPFLPYHMFASIASPPLSSLWSGISGI